MKKNTRTIIYSIGSLLLVGIIAWQLFAFTTSAQPLSESDAKQLVEEMYAKESANIVDINLNKNIYQVTLEIENRTYEVMIEKNSGEVFGIYNNTSEKVIQENQKESNELTEDEIKDKIYKLYQGDLKKFIKIEKEDQIYYEVLIEDKHERRSLNINALTGQIDLLNTEKVVRTEPAKRISKEEAIKIALQTVSGEVDDVDLETIKGVSYYFIEIERSDDTEATVQINAITGEVVKTYWDD